LQLSYVGALGRRLFDLIDINQAAPGTPNTTAAIQTRRPFYNNNAIPNAKILGAINQLESEGSSSYNSAQVMVRTSNFHGVTAQGSYTYGHALDVVSGTRGFAPQISTNLGGEYGNSDFDIKHTFNGYIVYEAPQIGHSLPLLTKGWQGNAFVTAFSGQPVNVKLGSSVDNSGTGEFQDRPNLVGNPAAGVSRKFVTPAGGGSPYVQWYTSSAFAPAAAGSFGTLRRNVFRGPGFATVDASLVKNTQIHERLSLQLRAEMFNIFNRTNLAQPGVGTLSSSTFGRSTTTRNNANQPGIGPGEPFNVQFAGKIIF
jgi:hypothetical protein